MSGPERVRIGQIVAPQGVHGDVRVYPLTDFPERWRKLRSVYVGDEAAPRSVSLRGFVKGDMPVLRLEGVADRSAAEALRGRYLSVPQSAVHALPPDTYYLWQLQGLAVVDPAGEPLGTVADVEPSPANDLLVVQLPDGRRCLVPAVREFVLQVDLAGGRVVLRPIPGLLE